MVGGKHATRRRETKPMGQVKRAMRGAKQSQWAEGTRNASAKTKANGGLGGLWGDFPGDAWLRVTRRRRTNPPRVWAQVFVGIEVRVISTHACNARTNHASDSRKRKLAGVRHP